MTRPLKKLSGSAEKTKEMLEELNKRFAYAKRHGVGMKDLIATKREN
jgi:hypothetical protein